ncbi:YjbH domain-containing protein [Candidatus Neptunochlamydia vexilliferae]|uniref:YjbH domain-containing protein n=1 Tax=Candidatus Neptunichlamydia vexilliferae TaxID=1651774 RepID=UPI001891C9FF|nr:YjbH domain-containing protein [Candidatus Neptunochlamydia vexilliferae]
MGVCQRQRSRFSSIEAVPYPGDRGDAEGGKSEGAGAGKTEILSRNGYKEEVSQLFRDLSLVNEVNQEINDRLPYHYNYSLMGGYFLMPSARMNTVGTAAIGFAYVPPYRNYAATIQALERLEFGINYTTYMGIPDPVMGDMGFGDFTDRGANVKLGVLQKSDGFPHFPEISVGWEDFYGTKRFHAFYVVATKEFLDYNFEATVGWGKGRIKGFFGGAAWTPFRKSKIPGINRLTLLAEWDATDYEYHAFEHPDARRVKSRLNIGLSTSLFDVFQINVSSLRGEKIAASASLNYNLGDTKGFFPKIDDPPIYQAPIDTEPLGYLRSERELAQELAVAFSEQGLNLYRIYLTKNSLWMKIMNIRYREERELKERIDHVLAALLPSNIESVTVVIEANGISTHEYFFREVDLARLREGTVGDFEFQTLTPMREPTSPPNPYEGSLLYHRSKAIWTFTVRPRLLTFFGSATGKFKYSAGVVAGPEGYLFDQFYYKIQAAYNVKSSMSDVGDRDKLNPSQLLNVRSDSIKYFQTNSVALEEAYIQRGFYLSKGWYGRVSTGYFEPAYGGVAAELLYYPVGSNWAVGFAGAGVLKRKFYGLGFTTKIRKFDGFTPEFVHFIGYQYFLDLYYNVKPLYIDLKASIGKFLARDVGARFEVSRWFSSGFRFGVWYTLMNAHDTVNGSRYRDKGIAFEIPLDFFMKKSSRTMVPYALSVWLRDQGVRALTGKRLYPTLREERN